MLQSSFFGGPRGKDFLITKIFDNAKAVKKDLEKGSSSDVRVDDYILISYGVLSYSESSDYQNNLKTDDTVNYNAKVYQKVINNDSISSSNNDILNSSNDKYAYKFIVDLSSELRINFTDTGDKGSNYNLIYKEENKTYELNMPKPSISYKGKKLKIVLNGETLETEVVNNSINIDEKFSLKFSGENFDSGFEKALNDEEDFEPVLGEWYLFDCEFTDTSSIPSYWTVFAYAHKTKTTDISNSECIVYSKVSGNAGSSLPGYITEGGISIDGENNQKTVINTATGLITTGTEGKVLPGQIVYKTELRDEEKKYYYPISKDVSNNLYYEPSPLEKELYEKIQDLQNNNPNEKEIKETKIIFYEYSYDDNTGISYPSQQNFDQTNSYTRTSASSSSVDVFSINSSTNHINLKYLNKTEDALNEELNLYDLSSALNLTNDDLQEYSKIALKFSYKIKENRDDNFYLSLVNINDKRKERIITLDLQNGFENFELIFKRRQDGNFYLSLSEFEESWKKTFYYAASLTEDSYSSSTSLTSLKLPFFTLGNYIYLSINLATGSYQKANSDYYKNFTDYFRTLSVTLKGYKD